MQAERNDSIIRRLLAACGVVLEDDIPDGYETSSSQALQNAALKRGRYSITIVFYVNLAESSNEALYMVKYAAKQLAFDANIIV